MYLHFMYCAKMKWNLCAVILASIVVSCGQVKDIAYFRQIEKDKTVLNRAEFDAPIKAKDILYITVVSSEPAASRMYNLISPQSERYPGTTASSGISASYYNQAILQNYLVDSNGDIHFPVLGVIGVKGMTTKQLSGYIGEKLDPFFSEEKPVITVRILNYSVNIIGEVLRPGKYESANGRLTLLEGLAMAGDMTIYGRRDNVKVIREDVNGERIIYTVNLNNKNMFNSPVFYLEQNDVVYVEPNQSRSNASRYGAAESYRISSLSVLISLVTMAVSILGISR